MNKAETKSRDRTNAKRASEAKARAERALELHLAGVDINEIARGIGMSVKTTRRYITKAGGTFKPAPRTRTRQDMKANEVAICRLLKKWRRPDGQNEALAAARSSTVRVRNLRAIAAHYANACAGPVR